MRELGRIPRILVKLYRIWVRSPDLRLCQLLSNAEILHAGVDAYYKEDDAVEEALDRYAKSVDILERKFRKRDWRD